MTNIVNYDIDYDSKGGIWIAVDHDIVTGDMLHEINDFWSDSKYRLARNNGDILTTVLKMITRQALYISVSMGYNTFGVVEEFSWEEGNGVEGFPPMDGTQGFEIKYVELDIFDYDDMTVEEK